MQPDTPAPPDTGSLWLLLAISAVVYVVFLAAQWRMFTKAQRPGWAAIIPIYNTYVLLRIAGWSGWWLILFFVPLVNIVLWFAVSVGLARAYGKGGAFGFFLLGLVPVGFLILGFGRAQYVGRATSAGTHAADAAPVAAAASH